MLRISRPPSVVIVVPVAEIEPEKAFSPTEPSALVITLPPVRTTLPPDSAKTPAESIPVVTIVARAGEVGERRLRVIVDPTPVAKTAGELEAEVVMPATSNGSVPPSVGPPSIVPPPVA